MKTLRLNLVIMLFAGLRLTTAVAEPVTVKIAYLPLLPVAPLFVMQREVARQAPDVRIELTRFNSGPTVVQAVSSGQFDGVYMGVSPVLVARAADIDLRAIAVSGYEPNVMLARGPLAKSFADNPEPANAFKAFAKDAGRPVRIVSLPKGSIPATLLTSFITRHAIDPSTVQVLYQGEEAIRQSLLSGAADASIVPEPIITLVRERVPDAKVVVSGHDLLAGQPGFVLALRDQFIAKHREVVAQLERIHDVAVQKIADQPDEVVDEIQSYLGKGLMPRETILGALRSPYTKQVAHFDDFVAGTRALQQLQLDQGIQRRRVTMEEFFVKKNSTKQ